MKTQSLFSRCAGVVLLAGAHLAFNVAHADIVTAAGNTIVGGTSVFDNFNGFSVVESGTATAPTFSLAADTYIAELDLYHKTDNPAVVATGQIGFRNLTTLEVFLFDTSNTVPYPYDIYTYVHYATVGRTFAAGNYEVVNQDVSSWAFNSTSDGKGFAIVYAAPAPVSLPGTLTLVGAGFLAMGVARRRQRNAA